MDCKNCAYSLNTTSNFCQNCGAKVVHHRLTLKNFWSEFSQRFLNYDNTLFKTIRHMFSQPEVVIDGYIQGTRKKYLNVFNYFALAITITGFITFLSLKFYPEVFKEAMNIFSSFQETEAQKIAITKTLSGFFDYQSLFYFLTIPILALISKIVFYNYKKYNYTEHAVIYLYAYSHTLVIINILYLLTLLIHKEALSFLTLCSVPLSIVYIAYILKRLYQLTFKQILLKTLFFILIGSIAYIFVIFIGGIILLLIMIFDGSFMEMIEEQRKLRGK